MLAKNIITLQRIISRLAKDNTIIPSSWHEIHFAHKNHIGNNKLEAI